MNPNHLLLVSLALVVASEPLPARQDAHGGHQGHRSHYADQDESGIAAMSRQELESLQEGAGMGLARAAELNHYPGPKHVLELVVELDLSFEQTARLEEVRSRMLDLARRLGAEIVEEERHLDRRFAHRHIDEEVLEELTRRIAGLYGQLRFAHLRAHLETREILSAEQVASYDRLRGYESP